MRNPHTIPVKQARSIAAQAQHPIDVDEDFDLVLKVRGGEVHSFAVNTTKDVKPCIECVRYSDLLARRERESYPNVAEGN